MTGEANSFERPEDPGGDLTGRVLGRYRIELRLGKGGMGEVYLAEDLKLKRPVALKRIAPQWHKDPLFAARFQREVDLALRFSHPHVAAVYDVFEHDGETFLVMEYVEGEDLRRRLHGAPIPIDEFLDIARQCASALTAAHEHGVVHRDLKPENILLTRDGQVKIVDFGLGKELPRSTDSTLPLTEPGLKGTPGYMAPEALLEKETDARADLFSLGVVFYEMLTGRHPFLLRGESFVQTANRVLGSSPKPVGELNRQVTPQIEAIVSRLLEKEPVARYASAGQLASDLKAVAGGLATPAFLSSASRPRGRAKRFLWVAAAAGAAILVAGAGIWLYRRATRPVVSANDWILVTDFSNQSGQPIFDDTVTEALRDALEQSRRVRLVPRSQVMAAARLMGQGNVTKIEPALGRQICEREGYPVLLAGDVHYLPPDYLITVRLEAPEHSAPLFSGQATIHDPAQLYPAVDKLARQLREHLGESLAEIRKTSAPLAQVTTPSLEALQRYTRALRLYNEGQYPDALALFQSAISVDPNFAMAHLYSAQIDDLLGNLPSERTEMAKAMEGIDRVSERERYLIQAVNLEYESDYGKAAGQYRVLTELYPNDLSAWEGLGESAENAGMSDQAIAAERRVLEISPDSGADYGRLVNWLAIEGHAEEALKVYEEARQHKIDNTQLHRGAGVAYMVLGNLAAAEKEFALCASSGGLYGQNFASLYQADLLLYEGKLSQAVDTLRSGLVLDLKLGSRAYSPVRRHLLGQALLALGETSEARDEARKLAALAAEVNFPEAYDFAGELALRTGQRGLAQASLAALGKLRAEQPNSASTDGFYESLLGAIDLDRGQAKQAIKEEQQAYAFYAIPDALLVQGKAYMALGQWDKAAASFQTYLGQAGNIFSYFSPLDWALAHLDSARALARGKQAQPALKSYDEFLKLWAGADPEIAALREARAERDRLAARATPSSFRSPSKSTQERR